MIDIESKIISYREDTNDYRLCLTREEIEEIKSYMPLTKMLVDLETDFICEKMFGSEYCEENCKYICPQEECYLRYAEQLKEQK